MNKTSSSIWQPMHSARERKSEKYRKYNQKQTNAVAQTHRTGTRPESQLWTNICDNIWINQAINHVNNRQVPGVFTVSACVLYLVIFPVCASVLYIWFYFLYVLVFHMFVVFFCMCLFFLYRATFFCKSRWDFASDNLVITVRYARH